MILFSGRIIFPDGIEDIQFDKTNLISISFDNNSRTDNTMPVYSLISNSGQLQFIDKNGVIPTYSKRGYLIQKKKVEITIKNTLTGKTENINCFYSESWKYDKERQVVQLSLTDSMTELQNVTIPTKYVGLNNIKALAIELYNIIVGDIAIDKSKNPYITEYGEFALTENPQVEYILQNTLVAYPRWQANNAWALLVKLCELCGLHIYKDFDGKIKAITE